MDVAKVQKLNQMAVNLAKHNIVSRDDAINRAASIYGEENNFSKPNSQPVYETQSQDLSKDVRKLMFALQHLSNAFSELKHSHDKLEKDFNDFIVGQRRWDSNARGQQASNNFVDAPNLQANSQGNSRVQAPMQGTSDAQARLLAAMEPARTKSTRDPNKAIDRNNVAPSEVSIDKFFYSGSRR